MYNIPTINMIKTGEQITELRKKSGLSVRQLQEIFGFATPQAIYKWQKGVTLPAPPPGGAALMIRKNNPQRRRCNARRNRK